MLAGILYFREPEHGIFYPIHNRYIAHTDEPFDFAQTHPLKINLQGFYHIIGINLFSLFENSKIVMTLFA
jgi:hypothetical protein